MARNHFIVAKSGRHFYIGKTFLEAVCSCARRLFRLAPDSFSLLFGAGLWEILLVGLYTGKGKGIIPSLRRIVLKHNLRDPRLFSIEINFQVLSLTPRRRYVKIES